MCFSFASLSVYPVTPMCHSCQLEASHFARSSSFPCSLPLPHILYGINTVSKTACVLEKTESQTTVLHVVLPAEPLQPLASIHFLSPCILLCLLLRHPPTLHLSFSCFAHVFVFCLDHPLSKLFASPFSPFPLPFN